MTVPTRHRPPVRYATRGRIRVAGDILRDREGSLLDIGARDRSLRRHIDTERLRYVSADLDGAHDLRLDLERSLPLRDRAFDYVVALDVLEHVDAIHGALAEILRVTRRLAIVALPNMSSLRHRWSFATHGRLRTRKYDLSPEAPADRHRWLTTYPQIDEFLDETARRQAFAVARIDYETDGRVAMRVVSSLLLRAGAPLRGLLTSRSIFTLSRLDPAPE